SSAHRHFSLLHERGGAAVRAIHRLRRLHRLEMKVVELLVKATFYTQLPCLVLNLRNLRIVCRSGGKAVGHDVIEWLRFEHGCSICLQPRVSANVSVRAVSNSKKNSRIDALKREEPMKNRRTFPTNRLEHEKVHR